MPQGQHSDSASAHRSSDAAFRQLQQRHEGEKQQLEAEFARLADAMNRRHEQEVQAATDRLRQEHQRMVEYEEARARMEQARQQLEAFAATPSVLDEPREAAPELRALRGGY